MWRDLAGVMFDLCILRQFGSSYHACFGRIHDFIVMFISLLSERGLSLDRLHVLLKVHEAGSIAAAAPGDPVRQSQFSRQLRELSEYFGSEMARRQGKLMKLTPQGAQLADLVRQHFRSLSDFRAQCRADVVDYTIAAGDSVIHWLIIPRLGGLPGAGSRHCYATQNLRTKDIIQQLHEGRVDFAVVRRDAVPEAVECRPLGTMRFCALIPKQLLARGEKVKLQDLFARFPMAAQNTDGQFTGKLREMASSLGCELRPALACQSFPQVLSAVRSGAYAAIVPTLSVADLPAGSYRQVSGGLLDGLSRDLVLAYHSRLLSLRPQASALASVLHTGLRF